MEADYVADTVAVILRLEKRGLPEKVERALSEAESGQCRLAIPAMVAAEIGYLAEKGTISIGLPDLFSYVAEAETIFLAPITGEIIRSTFEIDDIPELHDRIIAGAGMVFDVPVLTNDPVIEESSFVRIVW